MKAPIFATLAMFSLSAPLLAQPQPQSPQQNHPAITRPDTSVQDSVPGPHTNATSPGDKSNPAPHIYKRGEHVSRSYGAFDVVEDWNQFHLAKPPEDSHWVKYGDNYMLVKIDTGLITDIVKAS